MNVPAGPHNGPCHTPHVEREVRDGVLHLRVRAGVSAVGLAGRLVTFMQHRVMEAPDESLKVCIDVRDASFDVSANELRVAAFQLRSDAARGRIAMVVASDFQFGLARMFGILCEGSGVAVRPFRSPDAALVWLSAEGADDAEV